MSQQLSKLYCIVLHTQCTSVDESLLQITWTWKFTRNKTSKTQTLVDVDAVDVDAVDPPSRRAVGGEQQQHVCCGSGTSTTNMSVI
jgi:hypothetical protein